MIKLLLILISVLFISCNCNKECKRPIKSTIIEVGGCNDYGYCSYMTDNGIVGRRRFPVKGEIVEVCESYE